MDQHYLNDEDFDQFLFIEKGKRKCSALLEVVHKEFRQKEDKVKIFHGNANEELKNIIECFQWKHERAVVFLDPFGVSIDYNTLKLLADTKAVDVWYLFSTMGVQRMLRNDGVTDPVWKKKLCKLFGDNSWEETFYRTSAQGNLFGLPEVEKDADTGKVYQYIHDRLALIFPKVADVKKEFRL